MTLPIDEKLLDSIVQWVTQRLINADSGHGIDHVRRVVANAILIARQEGAALDIVVPAAWLHDCVQVAKNSPLRSQASEMAAAEACQFLTTTGYPQELIPAIAHCILAHSFSAGIPCQTVEAKVVQDADRLEALGAIGIARCLMTGGAMGQRLYHPEDPFPVERIPADDQQSIDHFFAKLLRLEKTMQTDFGRKLAQDRTTFMEGFLIELAHELATDPQAILSAILRAKRS